MAVTVVGTVDKQMLQGIQSIMIGKGQAVTLDILSQSVQSYANKPAEALAYLQSANYEKKPDGSWGPKFP